MRQAKEEHSDTENHSPDDRWQGVGAPARNGSHDNRAQQRANAKGTKQKPLKLGTSMQNISRKDGHHIGKGHAESQGAERQDQLCANVAICAHVGKAGLDALEKWLPADPDRLAAALGDSHLDRPDRCEQEHERLDVVGAMHADGGNQETCEGRADGARTVESHRVERQRIEEVSWPGNVTHQGLARWILKGLYRAGQEAGHVNMPWLDTIRKDERRQDEVEEGVGDLGDDKLCFTTGEIGQRACNDAEEEKRNAAHRGGKTQLKR